MQVDCEAQQRGRTLGAAAAAVRTDMEIKWWRIGMETRWGGGEWEERAGSGRPTAPQLPPSPASASPGPVISTSSFSDSPDNSGVSTFDSLVRFSDAAPG